MSLVRRWGRLCGWGAGRQQGDQASAQADASHIVMTQKSVKSSPTATALVDGVLDVIDPDQAAVVDRQTDHVEAD